MLIALAAGAASCTPALADDGGGWQRRDRITLSGSPPGSVSAGQAYSFTPSASDSQGRTVAFTITNMPSWATFSTLSGQLSGTPSAASVGTYPNILITASDGRTSTALPAFTVQVLASPGSSPPPTISGVPPTTDVAGNPYSFQPSASGPSGATLAFSVQNKPGWASFSIATGQLWGTPAATNTGTYAGIVISVSDGAASAALPAFAITVNGQQTTPGTAVLSWTPPTTNTDGTALTDLSGYTITYGQSPSALSQSVSITNAGATGYTFSGLTAGVWYFSVSANASDGTSSALTGPVNVTVN